MVFWGQAPPARPDTTWHRHYRRRLGDRDAFQDRLFDPEGLRPPIWFQRVPVYVVTLHDPEGNQFCVS